MAQEKDTAPKGTKSYKTLGNVRHAGKHYAAGAQIKLDAKDAKPLLAAGAIAPLAEDKAAE